MSGLKRTTGATLSARTEHGLFVEAALKVPAYVDVDFSNDLDKE